MGALTHLLADALIAECGDWGAEARAKLHLRAWIADGEPVLARIALAELRSLPRDRRRELARLFDFNGD